MSSAELAHTLAGGERVLFGTRSDGNMSSVSGTGARAGSAARERLRARLGLRRIVRGRQVHGAMVAYVCDPIATRPDARELADADGQATALRGVGVMVLTADCMVIPKGATNKYTAELMMNFVYDPKIAAQIAAYVYYVSPVKGAEDEIKKLDASAAKNPLLFPSADVVAKQHNWQFLSDDVAAKLDELYADLAGA